MSKTATEHELLEKIKVLEKQIKNLQKTKEKEFGLVWDDQKDKVREKVVEDCKKMLPILTSKDNLKYPDIITDINNKDHVLIEGDNYHALSILNYTHKGKIDVIYIDPPYNTGNKDFIYNDRFVDKEDTYRHSKWLSFMESRLKLAKDLLSESGVIFISIDDNEQAQLKLLCDRIFGEENFVGNLVWENKEGGGKSDSKFFRIKHEYVLVYGRDLTKLKITGLPIEDEDRYKLSDEHEEIRGRYQLIKLDSASLGYVKSLDYPIKSPEGEDILPNKDDKKISRWRWSQEKLLWGIDNDFVVIKKDKNKTWSVYTKQYINCDNEGNLIERLIQPIGVISKYSTTQSNKALKDFFGDAIFNYSKPVELVKYLLSLSSKKRSVILDFFAGSGTTGQAVLELNAEDNEKRKGSGNRQFILVTNNGDEKSEHKICEDVTYPRLSKVINGYKNKKGEDVTGTGGNLKYLKADEKDFVEYDGKNIENLKQKFVQGCTDIICLKENSFRLVDDSYKTEKLKIYHSDKNYVAILFDLFYFDEFLEKIKNLTDKKVHIYIFSYTKNFSREEFYSVAEYINFSVEPIPEKILETYKKIFRI